MKKKTKKAILLLIPITFILIPFLGRGELLTAWYNYQLNQREGQEQLDYAIKLEGEGGLQKKVIKNWYIQQIAQWKPNLKLRTDEKANPPIFVDKNNRDYNVGFNVSFRVFHYQDEVWPFKLIERLSKIDSQLNPNIISNLLAKSNPKHFFTTFGRRTRSVYAFQFRPQYSLHYTSYHLLLLKEKAIPHIAQLLSHKEKNVRYQAAFLTKLSKFNQEEVKLKMLNLLIDPEQENRVLARDYMFKFDSDGKIALPILEKGLNGTKAIRRNSLSLLLRIYRTNPEVTQLVKDHLKNSNLEIKLDLIEMFGYFAKDSPDIEQLIMRIYRENPTAQTRITIAKTIQTIGISKQKWLGVIIEILEADSGTEEQIEALKVLRYFTRYSSPAIPAIKNLLGCNSGRVKQFAYETLIELGVKLDDTEIPDDIFN